MVVLVVVVNILYISGLLHFVHWDGIFSYVFGRKDDRSGRFSFLTKPKGD